MRKTTKFVFIALFSIFWIGCTSDQNDELKIHITNESSSTIDKIRIFTLSGSSPIDSLTINGIEATDSIQETWKDIKLGSADGTFLIVANISGKILQKTFGYYTNGILLDSDMRVVVYSDSLIVSTTAKRL